MRKEMDLSLLAPLLIALFICDWRRSGAASVELAAAGRCSDGGKSPSGRRSGCWLSAGFCSEASVAAAFIAPTIAGEWPSAGTG